MLWFLDIPVFIGLPLFVVVFVGTSWLILLALRRWVQRAARGDGEWDRVLGYAVGTYGVFYGVTLGLIAAGAYGNFTEVDEVVLRESSTVAVLFRSATEFPEPTGSELRDALVAYTEQVIAVDWPLQERLIVPEETADEVDRIQQTIFDFEPSGLNEVTLHAQTTAVFNTFVAERRARIALTDLALPGVLWVVLGVGALLNAVLLGLIEVRNVRVHLVMTGLISTFIAMVLYSIAGFDHAYAGPISVSPEYFRDLLTGLFARSP